MTVFASIYGVVDGLFVSNYVGSVPFAAVNFVMPFTIVFAATGFMLGAGGSALVAYTLGQGSVKRANEIFSLLLYALIAIGLTFTTIGQLFLRPFVMWLGASEEMLPHCLVYGRISIIALTPFMLQYVFQSFFVTAERPTLGLSVTIIAGIANIVLDAVFIVVLRWGLAGAALATALSQCVGGALPLLYFALPNRSKLRLGKARFEIRPVVKACSNGFSEFMSCISMSIVASLYNWQLMRMIGEKGVASFGVILYVTYVFISIFLGYAMGSAPVVAYHYGARNSEELSGLLRKSLVLTSVFAVAIVLISEIFALPASKIYVGYDKELLTQTVTSLRIYSLSFLFTGFNILASSFFTALNDGMTSATISLGRTLLFESLAVLILPALVGSAGIWCAVIVGELMALTLSFGFLFRFRKKYGYSWHVRKET